MIDLNRRLLARAALVAAATAVSLAATPASLQAQTPRAIEVVLTSFRFEPNEIQVRQGERVVLRLMNRDPNGRNHNMETTLFARAEITVRGDVFADRRNGDARLIAVEPGKHAEVEFTAPAAGRYTFICSIANHAERGQRGVVVVTPPQ